MDDNAIMDRVVIGPLVPRRGNAFSRGLAGLILRLMGWRVVGEPPNCRKFIITAVPHTSNMDGIIFLIAATAIGVEVNWVGKHTLFKPPWGRLLRWFGGVPVNRADAGGMVEGIIEQYRALDQITVVIAPEGTRSGNKRWKTGFHRIAREAGVPISLGFMDYRRKIAGFGPHFPASEDYAADLERMLDFYRQITPRFPEHYHLPGATNGATEKADS